MNQLLYSSSVRFALSLTAVFACAMAAASFATYVFVRAHLRDGLRAAVETELSELRGAWESGGAEPLGNAVRQRVRVATDGNSFFFLSGPDGRVIAGNIVSLRKFEGIQEIARHEVTFTPTNGEIDDVDLFYVAGGSIGDYFVAIGRSDRDIVETEEIVTTTLVAGVLVTAAVTLGIGMLLSRRMRGRLEAIRHALERVASGDLGHSVPGGERDDDVGTVVRLTNTTIRDLRLVMDSVQQISNDVAHDLKRPLTKLRDQLGVALDRAKDGGDIEGSLLRAQDQARDIQKLFEAMLRIAQIESGARRARFRPVRLDAVLQDLYSTFGPVAKQSGQTLVLEGPSTKTEIHGDEELLIQLFVNLIENCMVHNASGVTITLSLAALGETVVATVSDNGQGIPAEERSRVTQRFYRCDRSRSTGGSGLGLSLVAAVVSLHDATLAFADNAPGLVTTIVFPLGARKARQ